MSIHTQHLRGVLITSIGVLLLTPDSLLIRLIELDSFSVIFWRGLLQCSVLLVSMLFFYRRKTLRIFMQIGLAGLFCAILVTSTGITFIFAIHNTTVANTLVIVSTSPLFAAWFSYLWFGEKTSASTALAMLGALVGVIIIFFDEMNTGLSLFGATSAILTAATMAGYFVVLRQRHDINAVPVLALSGLLTTFLLLPVAKLPLPSINQWSAVMLMGLVILPVSFFLISQGPRYIKAAEVSLILLLETVLGPFWVWLWLHEAPSRNALIGASVVIASLALYFIWELFLSSIRKYNNRA